MTCGLLCNRRGLPCGIPAGVRTQEQCFELPGIPRFAGAKPTCKASGRPRMRVDPFLDEGVGVIWSLPEEPMRLASKHSVLRTGDSLQRLGLADVVAAYRVKIAHKDQCWHPHIAQSMRRLEVVAGLTQADIAIARSMLRRHDFIE